MTLHLTRPQSHTFRRHAHTKPERTGTGASTEIALAAAAGCARIVDALRSAVRNQPANARVRVVPHMGAFPGPVGVDVSPVATLLVLIVCVSIVYKF